MSNEICPRCGVLRDTLVSTFEKEVKDEGGKPLKIVSKNYHCSVCNSFVRCEDTEIPKEQNIE